MGVEVFLGSYFMATLIVAALLALIPAKIASDKGYSFGLWWFYGWMLWIVAIIHVSLIPDLEAERRMKEANQPKPNGNGSMSADTLNKYNELKEGGLITQEEFEEKKKEVLQSYTPQRTTFERSARKIVGTKESLLKRANLFLEDGDWDAVYDYSESVLDMDPECAEAYLLKLMMEAKATSMDELKKSAKLLTEYTSYNKVIRFADENLKIELQSINESITNQKAEDIYNNALNMKQKAKTEQDLHNAILLFKQVFDYKDAKVLIEECNTLKEGIRKDRIIRDAEQKMEIGVIVQYEEAIKLLTSISEWKNANELIEICHNKISEIKEKIRIQEDQNRKDDELRTKRNKKIALIGIPIACVLIAIIIVMAIVVIPNNQYSDKYNEAVSLFNAGNYDAALIMFEDMNGYKDSEEKIAFILKNNMKDIKVGETVEMGIYNNKKVKWLVLEKEDNRALVISKEGLLAKEFHDRLKDITWETCSLRSWLNGQFLKNTFSDSENQLIMTTKVTADKNPEYDSYQGKDTNDKIFLLSIKEAKEYFNTDEERIYEDDNGDEWSWWLRTIGENVYCATYVTYYSGSTYEYGNYVTEDECIFVRPAMWINLED